MTNPFPTQKQNLKRFGRADEGQALVLVGVALVVLMLMAGLGVDVGYLRYQKQQMQKAADAGAIAGASVLIYSGAAAQVITAAQNDTSANGFTNGVNGVTVTVNNPPQTAGDPFLGQAGYVEVIVAQTRPTFFMRVGGFDTVNVRGRAVASAVASASGCIYALAPSGSDTFDVRGNIGISSACGIYIESSDPAALDKKGGSGTLYASTIGIVGGCSASGGSGCAPPAVVSDLSSGQLPVTGMAPFSDPLSNVCPTTGSCPELKPVKPCVNWDGKSPVYPNTYCGISISGSGTYTFKPGVYILLGGGLNATGSASLNGTGVTFYNTYDGTHPYGGVSIGGAVTTNFSAPTSGDLAGMLFFQDRSVPVGSQSSSFGGNSTQVYTGALYFPTTAVEYKGTPSLSALSMIMVGYTLEFRGNATIQQYTFFPGGGGPITTAVLAE